MKRYRILVTGGAGFIGSHLVDALIEKGHTVRILDLLVSQVHPTGKPQHLNPQAEFVYGDVCDPVAVRQSLDGIEVVFHEAAEVGVGQSMYEMQRYVRANSIGTTVLLEALVERRESIRKLIVASSMSIYGEGAYRCSACGAVNPELRGSRQLLEHKWEVECPRCALPLISVPTGEEKPLFPTSVYAVTKQDQEQLCLVIGRAYKIPAVALRYFNVYGPRQALSNPYTGACAIFSSRLLNDQPPLIFEDGQQSRDFVHVSDIVQANLLALDTHRADYQPINIGTGVSISIAEVAQMLAKGLGKSVKPVMVGQYRHGDIRHCVADICKARDLLGYCPRTELRKGIAELLEWVRSQNANDLVEKATAELKSRSLVQ
jgi:dTDP-L-rhamnose 4-epimerase